MTEENSVLETFCINSKNQYESAASEEINFEYSPETFVQKITLKDNQRHYLINDYWKFIYGDQSNAYLNTYDDSDWQDVQLPHDYSLELPYSKMGEAESGYKLGGIGWYRKAFSLDKSMSDKRIIVEFGGIYMNSTVYINGHKLGVYPNGYTPFAYDLTDYIHFDQTNILAVQVNHKFPSSRWYSGSGIYRNVYLTVTDKIHVERYGVQVLTPDLDKQIDETVDVLIKAKIKNQLDQDVSPIIKQTIREKETEDVITSQKEKAVKIKGKQSVHISTSLKIEKPVLWSIENPYLYEIITEVFIEDEIIDQYITDYGFRTFEFKADTGFYLNGKATKLKGVSMHSDQGPLGSAAHVRAMERQVEILQNMGVNAIRVTHNPAANELIDITNKKGILLIDESFDTWIFNKNGNNNDYAVWFNELVGENELIGAKREMSWAEYDVKAMVARGINAPSIISWSVGNEVMEGNSGTYKEYPIILENLIRWVKEIDQTRPATIGDNKFKEGWSESVEFGNKLTEYNGLVGFNYAEGPQFDHYHEKYPKWRLYGAETASSVNSRGVYKPENYDRHLTSYDESTVGWGKLSTDSWYSIITRDFMAGEFVWTGFDYLGEPTPWNNVGPGVTGSWPSPKSSYFGIVDTAGIPKDRYYFYQSQWNDEVNTLHILPTWKKEMIETDENGKVRVDVYSNAQSVELFFKNKKGQEHSLGKKTFTQYTTNAGHKYQIYEGKDKKDEEFRNLYLTWNVPYKDGTIYAKSYDEKGTLIKDTQGRHTITNFTIPAELKLVADREIITADGRDLSYVTIDVLDENGNLVEDAEQLVQVEVTGEGELLALDNGNQLDHEPYTSGKRKSFSGRLVAIVKSSKIAGEIILTATSDGLSTQKVVLKTKPISETEKEREVIGYKVPNNYYVKLGKVPKLTSKVEIIFDDESTKILPVKWFVDQKIFKNTGTVSVSGFVKEYNLQVSSNITIIESIATLLNYSAAILVDSENVSLPTKRPLVTEKGVVLDVEFPVSWPTQNIKKYKTSGHVEIVGTSTIFGEEIPVSAFIRVTEPEKVLSDNIAGNNLILVEEETKHSQTVSLEKLIDGDRQIEQIQKGKQPDIWTNYEKVQSGNPKEEIIFTYATAQYLGSVDLYFYQDGESLALPEDVELYWSNEGTTEAEWTKIDKMTVTSEDIVVNSSRVTKINYRFNGIPAVGFKIVLKSKKNKNNEYYAVGLTQIELRVESQALVVNQEASLEKIYIDDNKITDFSTEELKLNTENKKLVVQNEKNAALTVFRSKENILHIISESEDHLSRKSYHFKLKS